MNVTGDYWQYDLPEAHILPILGLTPKRWGRMDYMSRIAIVEVGFLLAKDELLNDKNQLPSEVKAGLIVGTKRGSLHTDLEFCKGLAEDSETASPLLFSYTLPNIPLAEAASHYQIKGPVFSIYSTDPFNAAIEESQRWLQNDTTLSMVIAGELDYFADDGNSTQQNEPDILANFTIINALQL